MKIQERIEWLQKIVKEAGADGLAIAISGGIDSAVTAALAKKAFPNNTFGIFIGIESSTEAKRNFLRTINALGIEEHYIKLDKTFDLFLKETFETSKEYESLEVYEEYIKTGIKPLDKSYLNLKNLDLIKGNIKARLRMVAIYAHAQKNNYLVLETSNLSEMIIGYCTKWGDSVGDLAPITDLYKREVLEMAKELGIPKRIIESEPSADLWEGQTDEKEMQFTYDQLEAYHKGEKIPEEIKVRIEAMIKKNDHKKKGIHQFHNEK